MLDPWILRACGVTIVTIELLRCLEYYGVGVSRRWAAGSPITLINLQEAEQWDSGNDRKVS